MRALIRHLKSGLFYAGDGRWAATRENARSFGSSFKALTFAGDNHLHGVEVVQISDEPGSKLGINLELERQSLKIYGVRHGK